MASISNGPLLRQTCGLHWDYYTESKPRNFKLHAWGKDLRWMGSGVENAPSQHLRTYHRSPGGPYRYSGPKQWNSPKTQNAYAQATGGPTVADYMNTKPICFTPSMPIKQAIKILIDKRISGAPVVERYEGDVEGAGHLIGVLSEEDLMWKEAEVSPQEIEAVFETPFYYLYLTQMPGALDSFKEQAAKMLARTVGDSMNTEPIAVQPHTPVGEAAGIMLDLGVSRLPVVAPRPNGKPGNTVVGILTRKDILKHVSTLL
eukprot:TRINITY_DN3545_c0_g1_i1.p1 TRINITY_DN3545_c0_g1~~TRINITY_DN3545_c0_g1_i1.p1  ORF type:complete len:275 (-),score=39.79 TRINITY_DN3545_c0_g1_i1:175-951(-)